MSTTTRAATALPQAPWKSLFDEHINSLPQPEFMLATVAKATEGSPVPYVPRVRTCIFRGYWTELPENKHNEEKRNPRVYESDLPTFTTDVRMDKVGQIFATSAGHAESDEQTQGCGGGGPVEALWWIEKQSTQWRLRGKAYIVGPDVGKDESSSGVRTLKSELGKRMRVVDEAKEKDWSWETELVATFGNQSPGIKGSMKGPPPGRPTNEPHDEELEMDAKVENLQDPVARKNFRIVVIVPEQIEQLDLEKKRRYLYTFDESSRANAGWRTQELWP